MPGSNSSGENRSLGRVGTEIAKLEDMAEVQAMAGAASEGPPWPQASWQRFVEHLSDRPQQAILLLAREETGTLRGWLAATQVWETSEMEFVLVDPGFRGRGVGRELVRRWLDWAGQHGAEHAHLEVRASNEPALRLYRELGFGEQGRRCDYYQTPREDAVLMGRAVGTAREREFDKGPEPKIEKV